jgi:hypothetical protein
VITVLRMLGVSLWCVGCDVVWTLTFVPIRLEVDSGCGSHGGLVPVSEDGRR